MFALLAYILAISVMRMQSAVVSGNFGLTTAPATVCIMLRMVQRRFSCFVVVDKTIQAADIRQAQMYWIEYQQRRQHEPPG
jgi:hypothetical protein